MNLKNITIISLSLLPFTLSAQVIENLEAFKLFGDTIRVEKEYILSDNKNGVNQTISFIGEIIDEKSTIYKVFISQLNFSGKGVNDLIFLSKQKNYQYRINLSSDAPFKISFNELYFKKEGVFKTMKLDNNFNEWFCSPFECFGKI